MRPRPQLWAAYTLGVRPQFWCLLFLCSQNTMVFDSGNEEEEAERLWEPEDSLTSLWFANLHWLHRRQRFYFKIAPFKLLCGRGPLFESLKKKVILVTCAGVCVCVCDMYVCGGGVATKPVEFRGQAHRVNLAFSVAGKDLTHGVWVAPLHTEPSHRPLFAS